MFGELIIMIVYLPILTLEGVEGKLFRPMALTVIFALAGSMVLSLTLMPVLASLMLPKRIDEREPLLIRIAQAALRPGPAVLRCTTSSPCSACPVRAGGRLRDDRPQPGLGVHSQAVRRLDRRQHHPAGGNRPGGVDPLQHPDGKGPPGGVPRRDSVRLEPHRHGRSGDRPDGRGTVRHLHHAEAARAVETGTHPGRVDRTDPEGTPRPAGTADCHDAAHRDADERDDLRRPLRRGRHPATATTSTCW